MAKTLEYADTSAQTVKIGDTTTSFTMVLGEDSNPIDLTNATSIIAKIGNSTGYLKEQTVTSDNIPDPLSGQVIIKFDSEFMNGLPAGSYLLEVWVTYDSGVAIYPSGALTGFTINNNIEASGGSTITTITFDDFVDKFNEIAANALPGTTDTTNFQKRKITNDDGSFYLSIPNATGVDVTDKLLSLPSGLYTCYIQVGAKNNPSNDSLRGIVWVSAGYGGGIFGTNTTGGYTSYRLFIEGSSLQWKKYPAQTSGTLDVEPAFYMTGTTSSEKALNYVLTGNVLHVSGIVVPSSEIAAGGTAVLFNLPSSIGTISEYRTAVQQSSSYNLYCLNWKPNGPVSVIKHNTAGTATAITTSTELQVCVDIVINPS
ncbi:hypothetical protein LVP1_g021 [Lactobacillus phage P1]|uniref:Uncharacterized protein n=1 Tax=Lactobacillus phage P1 TaxID=1846168 RepID=A0A1S5RCQ5_9CAUD|nr:tail protein [Lactobacillus phage P1]ANO57950.1 hypothetical protein LVP1_g021 [Lactobacillus phage P1]